MFLWEIRKISAFFWWKKHLICCYGYIFFLLEPVHDKTYNKTCVTSKNSDSPVHPPSMTRVLIHPSLDSQEAVEGSCDQQRLWSDCADGQADLSICWWHKSYCRFCCALAHFVVLIRSAFNTHNNCFHWQIRRNINTFWLIKVPYIMLMNGS